MKTIKALLIASGLTLAAVAVSAQEAAPAAQLSDFSVGDTIVIKKDHERYLTGEKMSKWVYNVEHTIQQVGGKRFPNGILIKGIISWVEPDDIVNKTAHPDAAAAEQTAKQEAEQAATKVQEDSFSTVKVFKPKAIRRYKKSKKILKSSISSSSSGSKKSSEIKIFNGEESNIELENITIDEINNDFFLYKQKNEEEECFNELNELINSSKENKKGKKSSKKIKRCKNPLEAELEMMQESYVDELIQGLHDFCKINSGDEDEK